jgi:hypothetical protein
MVSYIRYANTGATRNRPLDEELIKRLQYLEPMGITAEVFSGGQPTKAEGGARVGSERHDHGGAGDVHFYQGDRKLDWSNPDDQPIFEQIVRNGKEAGITGFGAGDGYMAKGSMHIGMGKPGVWGANGKGDNAAPWLKAAYNGASTGKPDVIAEVMAAASQPDTTTPQKQILAQQQATAETKPESRNGILVDAYNRVTGQNVQVPDKIFGMDTSKFEKASTGIGEFTAQIAEQDAALNRNSQQIAAQAAGGRSSSPVELQMMTSYQQRKKRKGGLSGLGGYIA